MAYLILSQPVRRLSNNAEHTFDRSHDYSIFEIIFDCGYSCCVFLDFPNRVQDVKQMLLLVFAHKPSAGLIQFLF